MAVSLRIADARSRRYHRFAAGLMTLLVVGLISVCLATGSMMSLLLVLVAFVPLWLFVGYRAYKLPDASLVERAITRPDSITSLIKIITPSSKVLGIELGPQMLALRFPTEAGLDEAMAALAALAPDASVVPPLSR